MEWFKPTAEQIGSTKEFPVLFKLFKDIEKLNDKQRKKICRFLDQVNQCSAVEIPNASPYLYTLIRKDYKERLNLLGAEHNIPDDVISRAHNYAKAKMWNAIRNKANFRPENQ